MNTGIDQLEVSEGGNESRDRQWPRALPLDEVDTVLNGHGLGNQLVSGSALNQWISDLRLDERNRIAREVHDTLAQQFAGILLLLEAVKRSDGVEQPNATEFLARAKELAKCGLEDVRRMLLGLRPKSLDGAHLSDALKQLAERFSRDCGIECIFRENGQAHSLSEEVENELYRVAQEALCNVRKHSRAASVSILLSYTSDGVALGVKDNGQGFVASKTRPGAQGFGLPAMRDRARNLGGRMDINTAPGRGTELRMTVPLSSKTSKERKNQ